MSTQSNPQVLFLCLFLLITIKLHFFTPQHCLVVTGITLGRRDVTRKVMWPGGDWPVSDSVQPGQNPWNPLHLYLLTSTEIALEPLSRLSCSHSFPSRAGNFKHQTPPHHAEPHHTTPHHTTAQRTTHATQPRPAVPRAAGPLASAAGFSSLRPAAPPARPPQRAHHAPALRLLLHLGHPPASPHLTSPPTHQSRARTLRLRQALPGPGAYRPSSGARLIVAGRKLSSGWLAGEAQAGWGRGPACGRPRARPSRAQ